MDWLAEHPDVSFALVVFTQIALIAVLARCLSKMLERRDATLTHGIWLAAVLFVLAVVPIHLLAGGWPIQTVSASRSPDGLPRWTSSGTSVSPRVIPEEIAAIEIEPNNSSLAASSTVIDIAQTKSSEQNAKRSASAAIDPHTLLPITPLASTSIRRAGTLSWTVYWLGFGLLVLRMAIGACRLRHWLINGKDLNESSQRLIKQTAKDVGLSRVPTTRMVNQTAIPLVFGFARPAVLLPRDFESWPRAEQRAAILHEFAHIVRRDLIGQWISKLMNVAFWFHPASWYIDRHLTESREWATDRHAISCLEVRSPGEEAERYAECLINIIARNAFNNSQAVSRHSSLSMSWGNKVEKRLKHLLRTEPQRSRRWTIIVNAAIACLALMVALTTVRIKEVMAEELPATSPSVEPADVSPDDNDLFSRIRNAEVIDATGTEYGAVLNVSGQILSSNGKPIEGAIVLLRDWSSDRVFHHPEKYLFYQMDGFHHLRSRDVFARTVSDSRGRYEFINVKSPPYLRTTSGERRRAVVAAHPDVGVGWVSMFDKDWHRNITSSIDVKLHSTTSIAGRVVSPNGEPVVGGIVNLDRLIVPVSNPNWPDDLELRSKAFDLTASQLTPRALTNEDGEFRFTGVPRGYIASVVANESYSIESRELIATSREVPLGGKQRERGWLDDKEVVASPARMVTDPGFSVSGRVFGPDKTPIPNIEVGFRLTFRRTKTGKDGTFQFRERSSVLENKGNWLVAKPSAVTGFLPAKIDPQRNDFRSEKPLEISLEQGVLVSGRVTMESGAPMIDGGFLVTPTSGGGTRANKDGSFEMVLPKAKHTIVVCSDQPGFALPESLEIFGRMSPLRLKPHDAAKAFPHTNVDLADVNILQMPPIVVKRVDPIRLIASLPDGSAAVGAQAFVKKEISFESSGMSLVGSHYKSDTVMTDRNGHASVTPRGAITESTFLEVNLRNGYRTFSRDIRLSDNANKVLHVSLQPDPFGTKLSE